MFLESVLWLRHQLRNKTCFPCLHRLVKTEGTFGRIREQISENPRRSRGFSPAREFSQTLPRFSTGYGDTENMFSLFYKIIIFRLNKEKDDILSAYVFFNFFHETVKPATHWRTY